MASKLPDDVRDALLDKLSSDDSFRDLFQSNPREALQSIGLSQDLDDHTAQAAACLKGNALPSKQSISSARDSLRKRLASEDSYNIFKA